METITFHLEHFDGPLDLLLHLITKNKVSIYDIPIAQILEQYLDILHAADTMDMDIAGDFIAMAARLTYIKSRMLLPQPEIEETEDPRAQLVQLLLEYQRIKEAAPFLREQEGCGLERYVKPPEPLETEPLPYQHAPHDLVRAMRNLLRRAERRIPPSVQAFSGLVGREAVTVGQQVAHILKQFTRFSKLQFRRLFAGMHSRSEAVATFLAVLELSKKRRIRIIGDAENPELRLVPPGEEDAD